MSVFLGPDGACGPTSSPARLVSLGEDTMNQPRAHLSDVSIRSMGQDSDWTRERRRCFLIDPNIAIPKSVDSNVWESIVSTDEYEAVGRTWHWHDWPAMLRAHERRQLIGPRAAAASILYADIGTPDHMWVSGLTVEEVHRFGVLLGYDVADIDWVSGLSNCGYERGEVEEAGAMFGRLLNENGLFTDFDAALRCAEYTSLRVPEHAPFYPYGVYVLKEWA